MVCHVSFGCRLGERLCRVRDRCRCSDYPRRVSSPGSGGQLNLVVRILGAGNAEQASLSFAEEIVSPNVELETVIGEARIQPVLSNPDVARELMNNHNLYYQDVELQTPQSGDGFH